MIDHTVVVTNISKQKKQEGQHEQRADKPSGTDVEGLILMPHGRKSMKGVTLRRWEL